MIKMLVDTELNEVPINAMPLIDDTDFKTIESAVTFNQAGMVLRWNFLTVAGSYTQVVVTPTNTSPTTDYAWGNVGGGMYAVDLPASGGVSANNDTEGFGWFTGVATGVLPWAGPMIQFSPANVVNSLIVGSDRLEVDVQELDADTQSATDLKDFADAGYDPGTNKVQGVVLVDTTTTLTNDPTGVGTLLTRLGTPSDLGGGATVAGNLSDIEGQTDDIGVAGAGLTAITGLIGALNTAASSGDPGTTTTLVAYLKQLINTLEGSAGIPTFPAAAVAANAVSLAEVIRSIDTRLPSALVSGRVDASVGAMAANVLTASALATDAVNEIVDQTWEEAIADHSGTGGSTAAALAAASSAGDPWATALPGAYIGGSAGFIVGTNLNATVSSRASQTSVDDLPTNAELTTALGTADDAVLAQVALVKAKTDLIPASPAAVGSAMTLTSGERDSIADAHLDRSNGIETGLTPRNAARLIAAASAGKLSGAATTAVTIRNAVADSKNRIAATVDADGNRSAITVDLT